jgi:hypothetical protein
MVQNILQPSICQPDTVRVARVPGRVRSCPGSLIAAASTTPLRAICSSDDAKPQARQPAPAASATWRRRSTFCTAALSASIPSNG